MKIKTTIKTAVICLTMLILIIAMSGCSTKPKVEAKAETLKGYIIDYHCYVKKVVPAEDSKMCLQMPSCAASGYGIAVLQADSKYKFYYFDGEFSPSAKASQITAVNLINNTTKKDHVYISVTGTLNGDTKKSSDGTTCPIIKVTSMTEIPE